ncbi:hypothetical protein K449DRAFT_390827 [Hypoxylon sp. EC38]|nr:hypothetical protein K449DRAFT_390827 [Hypoxylon sp. EC38]
MQLSARLIGVIRDPKDYNPSVKAIFLIAVMVLLPFLLLFRRFGYSVFRTSLSQCGFDGKLVNSQPLVRSNVRKCG